MDNSLFFKSNMSEVQEEFEINGISKFKYPKGHEKEGQIIPWVIKKLKTKRVEELTALCTNRTIKNGEKFSEVDYKRLGELTLAETIVFPDLKDTNLQSQYGCIDNVSLMRELLEYSTDYGRIFTECNAVNNITEVDDDKIIEEAKN